MADTAEKMKAREPIPTKDQRADVVGVQSGEEVHQRRRKTDVSENLNEEGTDPVSRRIRGDIIRNRRSWTERTAWQEGGGKNLDHKDKGRDIRRTRVKTQEQERKDKDEETRWI